MGATEEAFFALAIADGLKLERRVRLPWLTNRGHLADTLAFAVDPVSWEATRTIHRELRGDEDLLRGKRRGSDPLADFVMVEECLIVEVDEIQHFTSDRLRTLGHYPDQHPSSDHISQYRELISRWRSTADGYRVKKSATDFPFDGGRRAQRAYFDAVRDLFSPSFGLRVLRVPAPECDGALAYRRFADALSGL